MPLAARTPRSFFTMLERHIQLLFTDDAAGEAPAATRERLKGLFPMGATRRMTTLGMLVGGALGRLDPGEEDALVYASGFAETCALESFLDSFPTPSPTLFQTSIHPSAVQQLMIGRQRPVREFLPHSGSALLAFHALRAALLTPSARTLLCGGEERGTWLLDYGLASPRTFAFAMALADDPRPGDLGTLRLSADPGQGELSITEFFDLLHRRTPFDGVVAPGWRLSLRWR
jgi:hypothetical protein